MMVWCSDYSRAGRNVMISVALGICNFVDGNQLGNDETKLVIAKGDGYGSLSTVYSQQVMTQMDFDIYRES